MESVRAAIASEANTGKVRSDRIYRILSSLVDAVESLIEAPVAAAPQAAVPSPDPEVVAPQVPEPAPVPAVRTFGKPA